MRNAVAFIGAAGSGKDTAGAAVMKAIPGCADMKFAATLKKISCMLFGWDEHRVCHDLEYKQELGLYADGSPCMVHTDGEPMTRREILQTIGTDLFRDMVGEDVWARAGIEYMRRQEQLRGIPSLWVLTDVRFLNELRMLRDFTDNLYIIELYRPDYKIPTSAHASEIEWHQMEANFIIEAKSGEVDFLCDTAVHQARQFLKSVQ